jgi:hypothetical protein
MKRLNKLLYNYVFFNAFPVIIIVQNLSFFFFPFLATTLIRKNNRLFKDINKIEFVTILFAIGAILSTIFSINEPLEGSFLRSLTVLPNYLYWSFLILLFSSYAKEIDYSVIYKAVYWGVVFTVVYFYTLSSSLGESSMFLRGLQQNIFSFILICFAPMAVYYVKEKYGNVWALVGAIIIVLAGTLSGSRSGSILTLVTCFFTLYSNKLNITQLIIISVLFAIGGFLLQLESVKSTILSLNERTYYIIYETEETLTTDQSYLIRLAQVEKGIGLFQESPFFGIGLNNFSYKTYSFKGDFEGFDRLKGIGDYLDQTSAHNSYIGVLAEGGLFLFIPFALIIIILLTYFIRNFRSMSEYQKPFFWGIIGMCVHLYFISAILNVFAWMLVAIAASTIKYNKK